MRQLVRHSTTGFRWAGIGITLVSVFVIAAASAQAAPGGQSAGLGASSAPSVEFQAAAPGDPQRGREYFTGALPLQNRGPACMACHSVGGIGALGGGALGPDLTQTYTKFSATGLQAILTAQPFPTMNAVWTPNPITPEEQADLIAFLQQASIAERPTDAIGQLTVLAVVGAVVLLLLPRLIWRKRLAGVRRPLVRGLRRATS